MIVDTSALVAILLREAGHERMLDALEDEPAGLPAPARLEFLRVAAGDRLGLAEIAEDLLREWEGGGLTILAFTAEHSRLASEANAAFGRGNGRGGALNIIDLMVYATAKAGDEPLLCAGRDFATTDLVLHPASRVG